MSAPSPSVRLSPSVAPVYKSHALLESELITTINAVVRDCRAASTEEIAHLENEQRELEAKLHAIRRKIHERIALRWSLSCISH